VNALAESLEKDPMMRDLFVFETLELISQLESIILNSEKAKTTGAQINEVFRIVHTIKGSASMMNFKNIVSLSHFLEDAFSYLREEHPESVNYSTFADVVLRSADFIKNEVNKIQAGIDPDSDAFTIVREIKKVLSLLKSKNRSSNQKAKSITIDRQENNKTYEVNGENCFKALIFFEDGCEMENIRAFNVLHNLEKVADIISYCPSDIIENQGSVEVIRKNGFEIQFCTDLCIDDVKTLLANILFTKDINLKIISPIKKEHSSDETGNLINENNQLTVKQSMISVNVFKLDRLMDLMGELVISQAMVIQNPELKQLTLNSFNKASRQLQKVTNEMQDAIMSIRMVPLSITFRKMQRIVRDMGKKLGKEVNLEIIGEETEVDKNIIEHLSDPLIHLVRNAMDHGIEPTEERVSKGKSPVGKIILEAKNEGGHVWIIVRDDGKGIDKENILHRAKRQGLLKKTENELTDREIYSYIFTAGLSTKEEVTEFSGRGVGMDVVNKNIEEVGGTVQADSILGTGTTISIKIPLTLAIIDGMKVRVGKSVFVIPITSIKESFNVQKSAVIRDETGKSEMILFRGNCCSVLRLHKFFKVQPDTTNLEEGIVVAIENESRVMCLFADELLGAQQVVVKAIPRYIKNIRGISGCTIMGDGKVSLIIDVSGLFDSS
jgi:two-component system chemotaxis sensor kinase CheA